MATYVQEQLDKNFIRPSTSPAAAPCFFVAKKDGDLRPVQDYRGLNAGTIKKRYPLPLDFGSSKGSDQKEVYSLRSTCVVRIQFNKNQEGRRVEDSLDLQARAIRTTSMSFGFANAPPHFQWVMNSIFSDMLGKFVLVYLDDIIIYSPDPTSHVTHVRRVLDRLREKQLYLQAREMLLWQA
ncbi:hypothetical protein BASA83_010599 [Batrachochytrium salamandrivorans]|nr:hypothetical protein BASA83_010599 [Batrachochytrium salamandrivorans]